MPGIQHPANLHDLEFEISIFRNPYERRLSDLITLLTRCGECSGCPECEILANVVPSGFEALMPAVEMCKTRLFHPRSDLVENLTCLVHIGCLENREHPLFDKFKHGELGVVFERLLDVPSLLGRATVVLLQKDEAMLAVEKGSFLVFGESCVECLARLVGATGLESPMLQGFERTGRFVISNS